MKKIRAFLLAAAIHISSLQDAWAQGGQRHDHGNHSHVVTVADADFRVRLPGRESSYVLVDVDLLGEGGQTTVEFLRSLSPIASCQAFDSLGLPLCSTSEEYTSKAALHVLNHMGGATDVNVEWFNKVVSHAKAEWHKKHRLGQGADYQP